MYTGIHIYTHGDLPVGVLAAMAKYAVAAMAAAWGPTTSKTICSGTGRNCWPT